MKSLIVIPAYNEAGRIGRVVRLEWEYLLDDGPMGKGGRPGSLCRPGHDSGE